MMTLVFNGWAAGPETWALCGFAHDWVFSYVEQLDGLPEQVLGDAGEAVLVGFSMGGSSALRLWLRYPEKVKALVLVSATPCMMERRTADGVAWKGMSERRLAALQLGTRMAFGNDPSPAYDERNMERGLEYLRQTDLREPLLRADASVRAALPVRILQSERDGIVRADHAAFLRQVFPQAKVTMVPGGEHVLPVTAPELVDAAVAEVLPRAGASAGRSCI